MADHRTSDRIRLSAVIPVYNEAACLREHVPALSAILTEIAGDAWEILLVDDGSTDGTDAIVAEVSADPRVRGLRHEQNQGKGAAVRTGVLATKGELFIFCDADMSTPVETARDFVAALEAGADVVVGNRKSREATIERWQPPLRTWLGLGFTKLSNVLMGLEVSDYTCGFKAFRGEAGRRVFERLATPRWSFDVELLALAARDGLTIREIPVRWHHEADTRVRVFRDVIGSFVELLAIRRRLGRMPPPKP